MRLARKLCFGIIWGPMSLTWVRTIIVSLQVDIRMIFPIVVLTGICRLVLEHFHELVKAGREKRAEKGTDPVNLREMP